MNYIFALHIAENVQHLAQEKSATVFAHSSAGLAKVEEEAAWNILQKNEDKILDLSARWFLDIAVGAISEDADDVGMVESLKNLDFLLD